MKPDSFKNILVIQTAFIGDAILASSLLEKLHRCFPQAAISILVRKGNESLYDHHPFLEQVLVWNKQQQKLKNLFSLLGIIRRRRFDMVVNCHRHASSGFLTGFSKARYTTGYKQNPFSFLFNTTVKHIIGNGTHETERYNQLVESITDAEVAKPRLYPTAQQLDKVAPYKGKPYVCIAPSSVWFTKQLPKDKWVQLCNQLPHEVIYLLGAPGDTELCTYIQEQASHPHIEVLAGRLSFLESCALMKDARMNYVNDSAPLHLASAINAPVTAFFCSTVPEFGFTPLSDQSVTVQVDGDLECRPCGLHGFRQCPRGHFKCAHDINIAHVA